MEIIETLLQYDTCTEAAGTVSAVIVAAGSSTRMGGVSKQLLQIGGIPVLARTLLAFERAECIKNIVVVSRECDILSFQLLADKYMITKLTDIVVGGNCREESVKCGLERLAPDTECVLVHDGARPFVTEKIINSVAEAARECGAAACGVAAKDTLKSVENGIVCETFDRRNIYMVQTPQGFDFSRLREAMTSVGDLSRFTDECMIMEAVGATVAMVEGSYKNIKITTKEDIVMAEGIIAGGDLC